MPRKSKADATKEIRRRRPDRLEKGRTHAHPKITPERQPLIAEPVQRAELINLNTSNTNIIQQLKMVTTYPYRLDEGIREKVISAVDACLNSHDPQLKLAAAAVAARLTAVNLGVFKQLASDQVQRHLSFDRQDEQQENKFKALESMSDEELETLQKLADRMGGAITLENN